MNLSKSYENMWYILVLHVPMAYPNTTKQNIPLGHPLPTLMEGVDEKVDFTVNTSTQPGIGAGLSTTGRAGFRQPAPTKGL